MKVGENILTLNSPATNRINLMDGAGNVSEYVVSLLKGTEDNDSIINEISSLTISVRGGNDVISNWKEGVNSTINGGVGDDYISNRGASSIVDGDDGNDSISNYGNYSTIDGGAGDDSIENCGTNVIINANAGNDLINISPYASLNVIEYSAGDGNDSIYGFNATSILQIGGGSGTYSTQTSGSDIIIKVGDGSIVLNDTAELLKEVNIIGTEAESDDTLDDTADDTLDDTADDTADILEILASDKLDNFSVILEPRFKSADAKKYKKPIQITGNENDNTIEGGKGNDTIDGAQGDDVLTGDKGKDTFIYSGGNDIITDYEKKDKIETGELVYTDYAIDGKDLIFNFGDDNFLTIQNGASKPINLNSNVNYYTADGVLDKRKKSITLLATTENFVADSKVETIDGSATGAIEITGNKKKNYITAGANGATLTGGKGNDTLVGGTGADLFIYENKTGKDIIAGFGAGDSIDLDSSVTIKDVKTKSGDTVLKFKGGSLTVKDTTEFNIGDTLYSGGVFIAGDTAKIYGSFKGEINLTNYDVKNFDASNGKKKLTITGNDSANSLQGGKKNDTLWGGAGNDTFIYKAGRGKDVIADYTAGDLLKILDKKGDAGTFSKATFKDDTLTLNVRGGGKVILDNITSSTSININGTSRTVSELIK